MKSSPILLALLALSFQTMEPVRAKQQNVSVQKAVQNSDPVSILIQKKALLKALRNSVLKTAKRLKQSELSDKQMKEAEVAYQNSADALNNWIDTVIEEADLKANLAELNAHPEQFQAAKEALEKAKKLMQKLDNAQDKAASEMSNFIIQYHQSPSVRLASTGSPTAFSLEMKDFSETLKVVVKALTDGYIEIRQRVNLVKIKMLFTDLKLPHWKDLSTEEPLEALIDLTNANNELAIINPQTDRERESKNRLRLLLAEEFGIQDICIQDARPVVQRVSGDLDSSDLIPHKKTGKPPVIWGSTKHPMNPNEAAPKDATDELRKLQRGTPPAIPKQIRF